MFLKNFLADASMAVRCRVSGASIAGASRGGIFSVKCVAADDDTLHAPIEFYLLAIAARYNEHPADESFAVNAIVVRAHRLLL
jgi:hypothetical protein